MSDEKDYPKIPPRALELLTIYDRAAGDVVAAKQRLAESQARCGQALAELLEQYPHLKELLPKQAAEHSAGGRQAASSSENVAELVQSETAFLNFLKSPEFLSKANPTEGYLLILSYLCKRHGELFDGVPAIFGGKRKNIARSEVGLGDRKKGVRPKPIPGTKFWADTNNDTDRKGVILARVLRRLGYGDSAIAALDEFQGKHRTGAPLRSVEVEDLEDMN
jgi:negative regulator of replication initiation